MSVAAAGYVRVSTEEQAREGYGLAAQEHAVGAYCQAQGWQLVEVYVDAGRSGKSMRGREELARLLANAAAGRFQRVVFWKLDRLARNLRDLLDICDRLEALEVGIVSIQEAIDTGTPAGRMVRSFLGAVAEFEREVITERIKAGIAEKARQGELVGPVPVGYQRSDGGAIVPDPATAPLISAAFTRYATGQHSLRQMAEWANGAGLRSTLGNPIDRLSIRKILTNPAYMGQVTYHDRQGGADVSKGKHPPIVDAALFGEVQVQLTGRQRRSTARPYGREPYPLTGVGVCGYDGTPLMGTRATNQGRRYMRCTTTARRGRNACKQPMVPAELLEAQVAAYVGGMVLPDEYLTAVKQELQGRLAVPDSGEAERLRRELERWKRLFVLGEIDETRLRRETGPLKRKLADLTRPSSFDLEGAVRRLRDMGSVWSESPRALQRDFMGEVFARVEVCGPQIVAITPRETYSPLFLLDRAHRFNGDQGVVWLPGQDSNLQPSG